MCIRLKGRNQPWDCADLDTSFLTLKRVHPNLKTKYMYIRIKLQFTH